MQWSLALTQLEQLDYLQLQERESMVTSQELAQSGTMPGQQRPAKLARLEVNISLSTVE